VKTVREETLVTAKKTGKSKKKPARTEAPTASRQAKDAPPKSEELYRTLVETALDGIVIHTVDRVAFANRAAAAMLGFAGPAALVGQPLASAVHPDDLAITQDRIRGVMAGEAVAYPVEVRCVKHDGTELPVECTGALVTYEGKPAVLTVIRDATERKRAEEALRENQANLNALVENTTDRIWAVDAGYRLIVRNAQFLRGVREERKRELALGASVLLDNLPQAVLDEWRGYYDRALRGESFSIEKEVQFHTEPASMDYRFHPIRSAAGRISGVVVSGRDITERKRAEAALRESERKHRTLFDNAGDAIFIHDAEARMLAVNPLACERLGYAPAELMAMTIRQVDSPEEAPQVPARIARLMEQGQHSFETVHQRKDGSLVPTEVSARRITWDGQPAMLSICRDITERRRAEEAVRMSEDRYRGLTEDINLGIYRNTAGPEGAFIEANPAIIGMFGHNSKEEFLATNVADLYQNPADRNRFSDLMLKEGFVRGAELSLKRKDGSVFVGSVSAVVVRDEQGQVKYYDGIIEDITERKRAEEALRESREYLRVVLDSTTDAIVVEDPATGQILDVNRRMCDMYACTYEEALRTPIGDISQGSPPYSQAEALAWHEKTRELGPQTFEWLAKRRNGELFWAEVGIRFTTIGTAERIVVTVRDITERKRAEDALRESEETHRALVEGLPDIVMRFDRDGRHLFVSGTISGLVDLQAEQFIGKRHRELGFPEAQCQFWEETIQRVFDRGAPFETEFTIEGKQGPTIFNWRLVPERGAQGTVGSLLSISRDITERKRAEEALRAGDERYRLLFASMAAGVAHCHMLFENDAPVDFIYLNVNAAFEAQTGLRNVIGRRVSEVIPGIRDADPELFERYGRVVRTGVPARFELFVNTLGEWFDVSVYRPHPEHFVAIFDVVTERKRAAEALQGERDRAQRYLDVAGAILVGVAPDGTITLINRAGCVLFGYSQEELIGRDWIDLAIPERERDGFRRAMFARSVSGDEPPPGFTERSVVTKSGEERLVSWHTVLLRDAAGDIVGTLSSGQDITERKRAEEALAHETALLAQAEVVAQMGSWRMVLETGKVTWSDEMYGIFGLERTTFSHDVGDAIALAVHPEDRAKLEELNSAVLRDGIPRPMDYRIVRPDGAVRWVHAQGEQERDKTGRVVALAGFVQDITERKRAEEALRHQDEMLQTILDSIPVMIALLDREGRHQLVNRCWQSALGYSLEEAQSKDVLAEMYPGPANGQRVRDYVKAAAGTWADFKTRIRDGRVLDTSWVNVPLSDGSNIGIGIDITARKRAEEEKAALEAQLQQAQKLESVGRLAGGVAHDFNNMLGVILGHAEIALGQVDPALPLHAHLEEIHKAAGRSADLTRQLLAFARKQTISPKVLDLNETIEGILKMLRRLIGEDIHLNWQPEAGLWPVRVDPSQIDQVLANLCLNARDAIADVGKITIETATRVFDADYCGLHAGFVPGEYVRLAVSDNGCGMDKETLAHVFEPFFTTKEVGAGTGLGLATVYGIVKQNDGFINVYSEPGQGTTFSIYLPRHAGKAEQAQTEGEEEPLVRGHETILLVEDELAILEMTKEMLELHGYVVLAAGTPGEAIRMAREHAGEIHLLMTDVVMPEMNGRDLARNLLSIYPHLKRLFTSGYTANLIAHRGVLDDGVHFLEKPFSMKGLAAKVRQALESN
jgi:two-component system cell cycle sensor histidine kinase/response regulator CckA